MARLAAVAVHLEHGDRRRHRAGAARRRAVDLVAGRVPQRALGRVPQQRGALAKVLEAELAQEQAVHAAVGLRVRRVIPRVHLRGCNTVCVAGFKTGELGADVHRDT